MNQVKKLTLNRTLSTLTQTRSTRKTNEEIRQHRLRVFDREKSAQLEQIRRVEKIEVTVEEGDVTKTLTMSKNISTGFDCARHLSTFVADRSCLALLDKKTIIDMNRPIDRDCSIKFLHFLDEQTEEQNRAYWRTCSFLIGYLLESSFKDDHLVELCSFPSPDLRFGSAVYDAKLNLGAWKASQQDLRCLSIQADRIRQLNLRFEPLDINRPVAEEMFGHDRFKLSQIRQIFERQESNSGPTPRLTVYNMGRMHVDITKGPLISSTGQIGRFELGSIHDVVRPSTKETIQRVQALSIPSQLNLHYWTFDYLLERAKLLNRSPLAN